MKLDFEEALFSVKCFVAAMLAFYIALRIGLTRPYWAVTTSYIVAQPLAGAVLSKAVFRLLGTALGATAAVVLVPTFVNEPMALSAALALWLGVCLYISLLDRTPRAYVFLLAGYTASIIGFPSVGAPGAVFTTAILRVQEIVIGIFAGSLVHGFIFPRTVTARLFARVDAILADAERWSCEALARDVHAKSSQEQRRIAIDLNELDQLSVHLPFDTARILPRTRTVRALQDRLLEIVPLGGTVEDRLIELTTKGGVPAEIAAIVADTRVWLAEMVRADRDGSAAALIVRLDALVAAQPTRTWRDMLVLNLCSRLGELIAAHRDARDLRDQIRSPSIRAVSPRVAELLGRTQGRALHNDPGLALRAAFGTFTCIALGCAFWIGTAWPDGAGAVLIAGVCCALFGNVDRPGPVIFLFLLGSLAGLVLAAIYAYAILPRVTALETFIAVMAPPLLIIGSFMARPRWTLIALGALLGFGNTVGFNATYTADFAGFVNGALAQLAGTGFAVVTVGLFQTIGTDHSIARLFRAGWRDVARRAAGRSGDERRWGSRMLDRVGLLLPRLAARPAEQPAGVMDALLDMRTGLISGRLRQFGEAAPAPERAAIVTMLSGIARYFGALDPARPVPPPPALLEEIDATVAAIARDPEQGRRRDGLILLISLRRNLYPGVPGYGEPA
ncbi:FUSC family protein [Sphingomonas nostoxanthinifaciens]|uniref:FUSC family protein n=1 Tax=Sphingomonas nostoxanthinifaciens TaxID=2872652 RepID=UPI001CC1C495|nr:FUSC family protein [Sphingomonas nostoxanthinifaciens]UAK23387.1 FUSC family protein [Sphingomonas nostoxanthinifaciens]